MSMRLLEWPLIKMSSALTKGGHLDTETDMHRGKMMWKNMWKRPSSTSHGEKVRIRSQASERTKN